MQTVPNTAFTTKTVKPGNPVKPGNSVEPREHSRYATRSQNPAGRPAFAETFKRAADDVSGPRNDVSPANTAKPAGSAVNTTGAGLRAHTMHIRGNTRADRMDSNPGNISAETAAAGANSADTKLNPETAGDLIQQLLAILQMLGLAGESEVSGQTPGSAALTTELPQTPALADLLKALSGQNQDLQKILGQLQKDLQQLVQQLQQTGNNEQAQAGLGLSTAGNDLWKALNLADSDVLSNQDFLNRLTEALGRIIGKTAAAAGENPANGVSYTKTDSGRTPVDNTLAQNPAGDNLFDFKAVAAEAGSQKGDGSRAAEVRITAQNQSAEDNGSAGLSTGAGETKQAGTQKTDLPQQAQSGQTSLPKVDAGQNELRESGSKLNNVNSPEAEQVDIKQSDFRQTEVKSTETSEVKSTEVKQSEVNRNEVKHADGVPDNRLTDFKGANSAPVNSGQSGLGQDQNHPLPQVNPELNQVQSFKMPEPPVNTPRMAQVIFGQITQKAKLLVTPGSTEMEIQLKPDFLGKMKLSITTENGLVTAKFNTESYRVKEVIEANLSTLKDSLAQQGVKVDQLVVNVSTQKDYSGHQEQNNLHYHNNPGRNNKTEGNFREEEFARLFPAELESKNVQAYYGNTVDFKA